MRQKEVMGQSIRTSKSARPGTITYVQIYYIFRKEEK